MVNVTTFAKHAKLHCMAPQFVHNNFGHYGQFFYLVWRYTLIINVMFETSGTTSGHNFYMGTQNESKLERC